MSSNSNARPRFRRRGAVALIAILLCGAGEVVALDVSLGPEIEDRTRMGPDAAGVFPVKQLFELDGTGIRIGQSELREPLDAHVMLADIVPGQNRVTRRPGSGAVVNDHATGVASILIGRRWTTHGVGGVGPLEGVAPGAKLLSSGGDYITGIQWMLDPDGDGNRNDGADIINMSAGFSAAVPNGSSAETLFADQTVVDNNVVWIKSAGNGGPNVRSITSPGDGYNLITVGRTGHGGGVHSSTDDYTRVYSGNDPTNDHHGSIHPDASSRGPTTDGRHKPDIVAPGSVISMAGGASANDLTKDSNSFYSFGGTSFAAPHVAGTAALLLEVGEDTPSLSTDHRVIKAVLMNSASKHVSDPNHGDRAWTASPAATDPNIPIDDAMGVGQLNALAAVRQYQHGVDEKTVLKSTVIPMGTVTQSLFSGKPLSRGSLVTATLAWDRPVVFDGIPGQENDTGKYSGKDLPNLTLELVKTNEAAPVRVSSSGARQPTGGDSVEHIYFNIPKDGEYQLLVRNQSDQLVEFGMAATAGSSDGLAFSVDGGHFNLDRGKYQTPAPNPAEGLDVYANHPTPNDVTTLGPEGPGHLPTEAEIFASSRQGTNMQRLSGALGTQSRVGPHHAPPAAMAVLEPDQRGVLGLQPNDNTVGLSWGRDGTNGKDAVLIFSVDPTAAGVSGTAVHAEAGKNEAAGDLFVSPRLQPFGRYDSPLLDPARFLSNRQWVDQYDLGLLGPPSDGSPLGAIDPKFEDDLDGLETDNILDYIDPDGDGLHDQPVFFTLDGLSPSLKLDDYKASDIFASIRGSEFAFGQYADGIEHIGLSLTDIIDALVLSDVGGGDLQPDGLLQPGLDTALFSLAPGSPSGNPGDIYITDFTGGFGLYASARSLGLLDSDNLNALDIRSIPAPMAFKAALLLLGLWGVAVRPSRRRRLTD